MRFFFFFLFLTHLAVQAQTTRYDSLWADAAVETRIRDDIEQHRKGDFTLRLVDSRGKPLRNAALRIEQTGHEFLFGCNAFMVDGYDTPAKNEAYETAFAKLFNFASVPFYWKDLEPQPGQLRFAANSLKIYRRPPPDAVLEFCQRHGLTPKGHTLVWNHPTIQLPDWVPTESTERERLTNARIRQIAARYGDRIRIWDVLNEATKPGEHAPMPPDYEFNAFQQAAADFPASTALLINEVTGAWTNGLDAYQNLIRRLLDRGAKVDGIGLQFHFFSEQLHAAVKAGQALTPQDCFRALDRYARFQKPVHITEITIPTLPNSDEGREAQAKLTRNFYRLWFSHPSVRAITWWNLPDGAAFAGEDRWHGGLINPDFSPKPAYKILDKLLNEEWKTRLTVKSDAKGAVAFRGFYGEYLVKVTVGKRVVEKRIRLTNGQTRDIKLDLNE